MQRHPKRIQLALTLAAVILAGVAAYLSIERPWERDDGWPPGVVYILERELGLRPTEIMFLAGRHRWLEALKPSDRTRRLTEFIPPDAGPYAEGLKALAFEDYAEARRTFAETRPKNDAETVQLAAARAAVELMDGEFAAAAEVLEEASTAFPGQTRFHNDLAYAYVRLGRFSDAATALQRAIEAADNDKTGLFDDRIVARKNLVAVHILMGDDAEAEAVCREAVALAEEAVRSSDRLRASTLTQLGQVLERRGRLKEARESYARSIEARSGYSTGLAGADTDFLRAHVAAMEGDYEAAVAYFEEGLAVLREEFYGEHPVYPQQLLAYSKLCEDAGEFLGAEAACGEALERIERELGPEHPFYATALYRMGELRTLQSRWNEAAALYERANAIVREAYGADHIEYATGLSRLGALQCRLTHHRAAISTLQEALAITNERLGETHRQSIGLRAQLAGADRLAGELEAARRLHEETVAQARDTLGPEHVETAVYEYRFAEHLELMRRYDEAWALYDSAIAAVSENAGARHPNAVAMQAARANSYREAGQLDESERRYDEVDAIASGAWIVDHVNIAYLRNNEALLAEAQSEFAAAVRGFEEALALLEELLGDGNIDHARVLTNLGRVERKRGNLDASIAHYDRALETYRDAGVTSHRDYALHLAAAAASYAEAGKTEPAGQMFAEALERADETMGPGHLNTSFVLRLYEAYSRRIGDEHRADELGARAAAIKAHYAGIRSRAFEMVIPLELVEW